MLLFCLGFIFCIKTNKQTKQITISFFFFQAFLPKSKHFLFRMRFASSLSLWLSCIASTTVAFSTFSSSSATNKKPVVSGISRSVLNDGVVGVPTTTTTQLNVASADTPPAVSVANMERGVGGRIEAAFEAAKMKGEAAFVSFITAGYPTAKGTLHFFFTYIIS